MSGTLQAGVSRTGAAAGACLQLLKHPMCYAESWACNPPTWCSRGAAALCYTHMLTLETAVKDVDKSAGT